MKQVKYPISVRLFFQSGDPSGICESYMDNFNGIVHRVPRSFINDKTLSGEINRAGVYFLVGTINNEHRLYIGEAEIVVDRLKSHDKSSDKSWFSEAIVITSEQDFLNKAKIKYLENVFYEQAKIANRYKLEQTTPTKSKLSKIDIGTLTEFVHKTQIMISALGYKFFEEVEPIDEVNDEKVYFYFKKDTPEEAKGYRTKEGFVVCSGSYVNPNEANSLHAWMSDSRKTDQDKIVDNRLTEDISFSSSSFALGFVAGSSRSGNELWKTEGGIKLGDFIKENDDIKTS